jgi:hypothetical protein
MHRQALTNAQKEALIGIINKLTDRRMPSTSAVVKNLAEEIRGAPVGKNWTITVVWSTLRPQGTHLGEACLYVALA